MNTELYKRIKFALSAILNGLPNKTRPFRPYLIHPKFDDLNFDFIITDEESKEWYDQKENQAYPELHMLMTMTKPNYHVLEVGVHNGFIASIFTKLLNHQIGRYHGIELMPACYLATLAQLKLNGAGANFEIINAAAGETEGTNYYTDTDSGNGAVAADNIGIEVRQMTCDSLINFFEGRVDLLKIDVEGFELQVLKGCRYIISQLPNIALELHFSAWPKYQTSLNDIFKLIDLRQYHAFYFCNKNSGNTYGIIEPELIRPFHLDAVPKVDNMNLFLFSKKYFPEIPV